MIRFLFFLLLFYLGYTLLTFIVRSFGKRSMQAPPEKTATGEAMVRDPNCGTYVPQGDAIKKGEDYFCSKTCRDEYEAKEKK